MERVCGSKVAVFSPCTASASSDSSRDGCRFTSGISRSEKDEDEDEDEEGSRGGGGGGREEDVEVFAVEGVERRGMEESTGITV